VIPYWYAQRRASSVRMTTAWHSGVLNRCVPAEIASVKRRATPCLRFVSVGGKHDMGTCAFR